jgi:hypothetical protein
MSYWYLKRHRGHVVTLGMYGPKFGPSVMAAARSREEILNLAVECEDCMETLIDFDIKGDMTLEKAEAECEKAFKYLTGGQS